MELISDTSKYKMKLRSRRGPLTQQAIFTNACVTFCLLLLFSCAPEAGLLTSKCDQFYMIEMYLSTPEAKAQLEL
jgi:hypothetical protein